MSQPKKEYAKSRSEHIKDIVIAVFISGVIAFIGGINYQRDQQATVDRAVKSATTQQVEAPKK